MRLGTGLFDPYVAILKREDSNWPSPMTRLSTMQDPIASAIVPADGKYIIPVRESSYGGGPQCMYLLHVGTFPRPRPSSRWGAGPAKTCRCSTSATCRADRHDGQAARLPRCRFVRAVRRAGRAGRALAQPSSRGAASQRDGGGAEPRASRTRRPPMREMPVAFNGIIAKPADIDFFRFKAKKEQALTSEVIARALRSPLDSVLHLYDKSGRRVGRATTTPAAPTATCASHRPPTANMSSASPISCTGRRRLHLPRRGHAGRAGDVAHDPGGGAELAGAAGDRRCRAAIATRR